VCQVYRIDPDNAKPHYNLGYLYERMLDYDKAIAEYQNAILYESEFSLPYISLGRLYLLRRNDAQNALRLLNQALAIQSDTDSQKKQPGLWYVIYKNRGWAHFNLKYYKLAEEDLQQALLCCQPRREAQTPDENPSFCPEGAEARCLLAQVYEAQNKQQAAQSEWKSCADRKIDEVEDVWLSLAWERVMQGDKK
jgi:tetratricopeptide (TPR) repeat protein